MYILSNYIKIGNVNFDFVCDVEIKESVNTLTDTCVIKLPKKIKWNDNNIFFGADALIKHKAPIIIKLGYDNNLVTVFKGYVRDIKRSIPVELHCEDEMFRLKLPENSINKKHWDKVSLDDLLKYILPSDIQYILPDNIDLGEFTIELDNTLPIKYWNI